MWFCVFILADYSVYTSYPDGSGVMPMVQTQVEMLAETVVARPDTGGFTRFNCTFIFKNTSSEPVRLEAGFPFAPIESDEVLPQESPGTQSLMQFLDFKAWLDGQELRVRQETDTSGDQIMLSQLSFEPGQTRRLICSYRTKWDYSLGTLLYNTVLSYTTTTGANWKGNIGQALFKFYLSKDTPKPGFNGALSVCWSTDPPAQAITDSCVVWRFKDWEPTQDLSLRVWGFDFAASFLDLTMDEEALWETIDRAIRQEDCCQDLVPYPVHPKAKIGFLMAGIKARHGIPIEDTAWQQLFQNLPSEQFALGPGLSGPERSFMKEMGRELERYARQEARLKECGLWKYVPEFLMPDHWETPAPARWLAFPNEVELSELESLDIKELEILYQGLGLILGQKPNPEFAVFFNYIDWKPNKENYSQEGLEIIKSLRKLIDQEIRRRKGS